ncbi:MAG: cell division protein ZapA [Candidatus Cryptobacteroides sp.]
MGHNIEIFIAGKAYKFTAVSQKQEEIMRTAAVEINAKIKFWQDKFPEKKLSEIVSIVALKICMTNIALNEKMALMEEDERKLAGELEGYLGNIDKNSR